MGWESPSHWVIIALVVVVLFGYKRLPEMSRSVGRSLRIFKTEMKGMGQDDTARDSAEVPAVEPTQPPVAPQAAPPAPVAVPPAPAAVALGSPAVAPVTPPAPVAEPVPPVPAAEPAPSAPAAEAVRETPQQQTQA